MLFRSQVYSEARGSIGGITYSRNKGGNYARGRATPTNPNTPQQVFARERLAEMASDWTNILDDGGRALWDAYALTQTHTNKLGETIKWSGQQEFIAANSLLRLVGTATVISPPTDLTKPEFFVNVMNALDDQSIEFTTSTLPAMANAKVFVACSRPQSPSRMYFKGPFCGTQGVAVNVSAGGTTWVGASVFPYAVGQKAFARFVLVLADGRYSVPWIKSAIVTAAP